MIALVAVVGGIWSGLAIIGALLIGRAIQIADRRAGAHGTAEIPKRVAA